jgi:hypothetical protein
MRWRAVLLLVAAVPATAQAQTTVAEFLAKTEALRTGGAAALQSPEIMQLRAETAAMIDDYRALLAQQKARGETPHSCPPPKGQARLGSNDLIREFRALPAADRGMAIRDAFHAMMRKRYPCAAYAP